ncbi:hypothetical protein HUK83_18205 [Endobacter medicaginis]|uniref:Uncharacterized protein n=1 Tax=Endobacter medicaginis TaxID=1181271 RepID=A0A850NXT6_9PROT|nr:hypothetical protein [Endobacter medicaginis]MCX5477320.1 hypothetical protein [Endobacter medicaginis]NVN32262.1 hypothetical protein [Endobacter medicaginis]
MDLSFRKSRARSYLKEIDPNWRLFESRASDFDGVVNPEKYHVVEAARNVLVTGNVYDNQGMSIDDVESFIEHKSGKSGLFE